MERKTFAAGIGYSLSEAREDIVIRASRGSIPHEKEAKGFTRGGFYGPGKIAFGFSQT